METFFGGMRIVSVLLQFLTIVALIVIGAAIIISLVCFVIGGILNAWEDGDDGEPSVVKRKWAEMFGGPVDDGVYYVQDERRRDEEKKEEKERVVVIPAEYQNKCPCRSCGECDTRGAGTCPSRKCEFCSGSDYKGRATSCGRTVCEP